MEKLTLLPNGQWKLEKGAMNRLAPKTKGVEHQFWEEAQEPSNNDAMSLRGRTKLVSQHIGNKGAFKNIDGVPHMMLHRGMGGGEYNPEGPMKLSDTHISHDDHGLYTDNHSYAGEFAGGKTPHSAWVPVSNINRNVHYEHGGWEKREQNLPDAKSNFQEQADEMDMSREEAMEQYQEEYGEAMGRGNHITVTPGNYPLASKDEVGKFLENHKEHYEPNESAVKSNKIS